MPALLPASYRRFDARPTLPEMTLGDDDDGVLELLPHSLTPRHLDVQWRPAEETLEAVLSYLSPEDEGESVRDSDVHVTVWRGKYSGRLAKLRATGVGTSEGIGLAMERMADALRGVEQSNPDPAVRRNVGFTATILRRKASEVERAFAHAIRHSGGQS